ncbi:MAG: hypothetical protein ACR2NZ_23750 [Rubripirellula sp.]
MGFTIWTFLGLPTLPTIGRQYSYAIDGELLRRGADIKTSTATIGALDSIQDDEPSRNSLVETIFHPVPSVENRRITNQCGWRLSFRSSLIAERSTGSVRGSNHHDGIVPTLSVPAMLKHYAFGFLVAVTVCAAPLKAHTPVELLEVRRASLRT